MKKYSKYILVLCLFMVIIVDLYVLIGAFPKTKPLPNNKLIKAPAQIDLNSIKEAIEITKMTLTVGNKSLSLDQEISSASGEIENKPTSE
jgi:hypothetical protein